MPSALAFFPWVVIDEAMTIGPLRLLPYQQGKLPGNLPNATQADIDRVLYAYSNRPKAKIKKATILELGEWQTGMDRLCEYLFRTHGVNIATFKGSFRRKVGFAQRFGCETARLHAAR